MSKKIYEYRGVEGLVYAPVTQDDENGFVCGAVKPLAGVAEIGRTTESSNEAHYYDNIPAVVVSSTGSDEVTITASAIPFSVLADINGQFYDSSTGTFIEGERATSYFAIGYITKTTDGTEIFVWRLKGTFSIPDTTNATEDDGTDANGQEITFTGIQTTHQFNATGKGAKAINVDTSVNTDVSAASFFASVQTPDTIITSGTPSVSLSDSTASVTAGETVTLTASTVPGGAAVTWLTSDPEKATVNNGIVTGVAAGSATITARITVNGTDYTATCAVTVSAA